MLMKRLVLFCLFGFFLSCSDYVERPANLLSEDEIAEIVAEITIQEELLRVTQNSNMENATRLVLQKYKVSAADFTASYKYHGSSRKLESILEESQEIIKKRHPKAEAFIEKELKKNKVEEIPRN